MIRYARQQILPEVGTDGQARLASAHVLVVGAGGLGCPALLYLAGAGVGQITVVDPDTVSCSNLHRQILYTEADLGQPKADVAARTLRSRNTDVIVTPVAEALTPGNAPALLRGVDLVLDCADSFAVSYILSDACQSRGVALISASALGFSGYVAGFCSGAPSLRAVFPDLPSRAATCDTAGVMGPLVGTLGAMQAQLALSCLLDLSPSPLGQMMTLDLRTFRSGGFRFDSAPEPDSILEFIAAESTDPCDFAIDLRDTDEALIPFVAFAKRLTVPDLGPGGPVPNSGQRAVLCCRSGLRAWQAARLLQARWSGEILLVAMGDAPPVNLRDASAVPSHTTRPIPTDDAPAISPPNAPSLPN